MPWAAGSSRVTPERAKVGFSIIALLAAGGLGVFVWACQHVTATGKYHEEIKRNAPPQYITDSLDRVVDNKTIRQVIQGPEGYSYTLSHCYTLPRGTPQNIGDLVCNYSIEGAKSYREYIDILEERHKRLQKREK